MTDHCRTNVWVLENFLPVRFEPRRMAPLRASVSKSAHLPFFSVPHVPTAALVFWNPFVSI